MQLHERRSPTTRKVFLVCVDETCATYQISLGYGAMISDDYAANDPASRATRIDSIEFKYYSGGCAQD